MQIRTFLAGAAIALTATLAAAAQPVPYSQQAFDQMAREGKAVVVDVAATWCPTCRAQKPIIETLSRQAAYAGVAVLTVDFDTDKPLLRQFKVAQQSTLIAFRGGREVARSVGDTRPEGIESLFGKASGR
jgi:thiol-disulfide isomerase/thioredoxin